MEEDRDLVFNEFTGIKIIVYLRIRVEQSGKFMTFARPRRQDWTRETRLFGKIETRMAFVKKLEHGNKYKIYHKLRS